MLILSNHVMGYHVLIPVSAVGYCHFKSSVNHSICSRHMYGLSETMLLEGRICKWLEALPTNITDTVEDTKPAPSLLEKRKRPSSMRFQLIDR